MLHGISMPRRQKQKKLIGNIMRFQIKYSTEVPWNKTSPWSLRGALHIVSTPTESQWKISRFPHEISWGIKPLYHYCSGWPIVVLQVSVTADRPSLSAASRP